MTLLPRFHLSEDAHADTQAISELSIPSASWSGYPAPNNDALIGQTLNGTYVVEKVLGEGGMGRVYRASHTRIENKRFAIKVLRPEFTRNTEVVARFRREAEAAACISHPNVVEVYDVDVTPEGYSYLVCEYLAGIDLADYLAEKKKLEPLRAVNLTLQCCHALEAAHESGVIHRDVKPHNIFLLADEQKQIPEYPSIKVLDFGLSRFMDSGGTTQLTRAGVIMGTPSYMSPEQAEGKPVDGRTDVYGLGAVLFAALAGRPPYEAESLQALVMAVINNAPDRLRSIAPEIPESLEFIVEHAMARLPSERYQNMAEFRAALEGYYAKVAVHSVPPTSPIRLPAPSLVQEPDDGEIAAARPKLIAYGILLTLLVALGLATSVSSIEVVTGRLQLSRLELMLLFSGLFGTLLTPGVLLLAKVRKSVWKSHAKVFGLLARLRIATVTTFFVYGFLNLVLLVADDIVGRLNGTKLLGHAEGTGFRGFNAMYFVIAAIWVFVMVKLTPMTAKPKGHFAKLSTVAIGIVSSFALFGAGLLYRDYQSNRQVERPQVAVAPPTTSLPTVTATPQSPPSANKTNAKAPDLELAQANLKGTAGLLPLSERYPEDPNVLRPLLFAFASRATGLTDAMSVAERLLRVSPEDAVDNDLRYLVRKATTTPGEASRIALDILANHMGSAGPDILYDLWVSEPKISKAAETLLSTPNVIAKESPSLSIAIALRNAKTCAARLPLLERAAGLGDKRSVAILFPLSSGAKRGCGKSKRYACPPICAEEARAYLQTVTKILERVPGAR